jgi:hypothetical protein
MMATPVALLATATAALAALAATVFQKAHQQRQFISNAS